MREDGESEREEDDFEMYIGCRSGKCLDDIDDRDSRYEIENYLVFLYDE